MKKMHSNLYALYHMITWLHIGNGLHANFFIDNNKNHDSKKKNRKWSKMTNESKRYHLLYRFVYPEVTRGRKCLEI